MKTVEIDGIQYAPKIQQEQYVKNLLSTQFENRAQLEAALKLFSEANLQTAEQLNDWLNDAQKWIDSYQEHTDERFVENRLRFLIIDLTNQFDLLQYSQFTIDWLQGLDERVDEDVSVENQELIYEIEYICQVLKPGLDKDLFTMLLTYAKQNRLG